MLDRLLSDHGIGKNNYGGVLFKKEIPDEDAGNVK